MPSHAPRRYFDQSIFDAHLIDETEDRTRLHLGLLPHEEQELDRVTEDEFRANYHQEYEKACAQAEENGIHIALPGFSTANWSRHINTLNRQHHKKALVRLTKAGTRTTCKYDARRGKQSLAAADNA